MQGCRGKAATTLANERCTGHTYFGAARGPEPKQLRLSCSAAMAMDEPVGPLEPSAEMEAMMKKMNYGLIKVRSLRRPPPTRVFLRSRSNTSAIPPAAAPSCHVWALTRRRVCVCSPPQQCDMNEEMRGECLDAGISAVGECCKFCKLVERQRGCCGRASHSAPSGSCRRPASP